MKKNRIYLKLFEKLTYDDFEFENELFLNKSLDR